MASISSIRFCQRGSHGGNGVVGEVQQGDAFTRPGGELGNHPLHPVIQILVRQALVTHLDLHTNPGKKYQRYQSGDLTESMVNSLCLDVDQGSLDTLWRTEWDWNAEKDTHYGSGMTGSNAPEETSVLFRSAESHSENTMKQQDSNRHTMKWEKQNLKKLYNRF